ncbi:MAG: sulfatase-like hydrolase/transferase, partial [Candidatus Zixiibacteriota bacterium]
MGQGRVGGIDPGKKGIAPFVLDQLKRLLAAFDERGLRDRTLIVLASDHGEGLFEHDEATHGIFIYETTVRVALILSCPALFDGPYRVEDRVVATVDILPTILDLLDVSSSAPVDGQSLLAAAGSPQRAIYIETLMPLSNSCSPLYGLRRHGDKYIQAPRPEYYDLCEDRDELRNIYGRAPAALDTLKQQLAGMMDAWSG